MTDAFGLFGEPRRGAFAGAQATSNKNGQAESIRLAGIADILIGKADDALHDGEFERARKFIDRAARLPYDEHEGGHPAVMVAWTLLFNEITDAMEQAERSDMRWLDAAVAACGTVGESSGAEILKVLAIIREDYELDKVEQRRVREVSTGPAYTGVPGAGLTDPAAVTAAVEDSLLAAKAYHEEFWHSPGSTSTIE